MKIEPVYYTASPVIRNTSTGTIPTSDILSLLKMWWNSGWSDKFVYKLFVVFDFCAIYRVEHNNYDRS